jgi:hypothetical protein
MAQIPAVAFAQASQGLFLRLPTPKLAVVYFYEGNDLDNNMSFLEQSDGSSDVVYDSGQIDRKIKDASPVHPTGWRRYFPFVDFCFNLARRIYIETTSTRSQTDEDRSSKESEPPNLVVVGGRAMALPGRMQSPSLGLTDTEVRQGVLVFERSLAFLRRLLPGTHIMVVYIPSPLSSYQLLSPRVSIQRYLKDQLQRGAHYPKERVAEYSDRICELIRAVTIDQGAGFLDLRPAIRAASLQELVHGPRDFSHFNRKGMLVLGQAVAKRIDRPLAHDSCGVL